ncbi:MAG: four helix bundle suffix domain-containing protein [Paludibacteraceae bacterium]|nr:four helix bundle suffix domain-containing protein [Paludibacteraceae bacterium]MBR5971556.1 four helix bundle suffix domain-containing protein [Paludibacteraceae bacterium]
MAYTPKPQGFLRGNGDCRNTYFYKKSQVIYDLTFFFAHKYLVPKDRTIDQMIQAARSGKQNFVEGMADGVTSTEMQIKLLNVGKSSLLELREDYEDYLRTRNLTIWDNSHPRYASMVHYCKYHNELSCYQPFFQKWTAEELSNIALTLIHQTDKMMESYLSRLEDFFVNNGGIKEAMSKARMLSKKVDRSIK